VTIGIIKLIDLFPSLYDFFTLLQITLPNGVKQIPAIGYEMIKNKPVNATDKINVIVFGIFICLNRNIAYPDSNLI